MESESSELPGVLGKMFKIGNIITDAVREIGGSDDDMSRLQTDPELVREIARVITRKREGEVAETERKFKFLSFLPSGKTLVGGDEMLRLCEQLPGREPTQADGEYLLANQHLIPTEFRRKKYLVITGWRDPDDSRYVAGLGWDGDLWVLDWDLLGDDFGDSVLAVRLGE